MYEKIRSLIKRRRFWNFFFFFVGISLFFVGLWQLDLVSSPLVWSQPNYPREVLPGIFLPNQTFYVMCFAAIMISMVIIVVSLWFWD